MTARRSNFFVIGPPPCFGFPIKASTALLSVHLTLSIMYLQDLPVELLDGICQYVFPSDLVALSRTSAIFYPVAQRCLYRHLSISSISRNSAVVITLARKPQIAQFVRTFAIRLDPFSFPFQSFYRHLSTALSSMHELTSLDVFIDSNASWVLGGEPNTNYTRLQHFACSFPFDSHVAQFLSTTPALLELELDSIPTVSLLPSPPTPSVPPTSLPRLGQFIGSSQAAKAIVPGRPVQSIHLNSGDMTEDVVECLAAATAPVVVLGASTSSLPVPLLEVISQHMSHLVYLRMMTTYNFSEAPDAVSLSHLNHPDRASPHMAHLDILRKRGKGLEFPIRLTGIRAVWHALGFI